MIDTVRTIKTFSLVLITIIGVATAQAGTVHAGHTTETAATEITTATITGVMGTTLAGVNGYYANGGSQHPLLAGRVLWWPILRRRILPLQLALLYRAPDSDSFLFSRLLGCNSPKNIPFRCDTESTVLQTTPLRTEHFGQ